MGAIFRLFATDLGATLHNDLFPLA